MWGLRSLLCLLWILGSCRACRFSSELQVPHLENEDQKRTASESCCESDNNYLVSVSLCQALS